MKSYRDYLDNITVDAALHKKIITVATKKPAPAKRRKIIFRYAGVAACVLLLFAVWAAPGLPDNFAEDMPGAAAPPPPSAGAPPASLDLPAQEASPIPAEAADSISPDMSQNLEAELQPLIFNITVPTAIFSQATPAFIIDSRHQLSDEELKLIFPNLNLDLRANAYYSRGTLILVEAIGESYGQPTIILLGEGSVTPTAVTPPLLDGLIPEISDIYGIPITVFIVPRPYFIDEGWVTFIAEFKLGNIAYYISFSDYQAAGKERLTEIINLLILGGAPDLSILAYPLLP